MVKVKYVIKINSDYKSTFKPLYVKDFDKHINTENFDEAQLFPINRANKVATYLRSNFRLKPSLLKVQVTYKVSSVKIIKDNNSTKKVKHGKSNQRYQV